jgi:hypothetical protein
MTCKAEPVSGFSNVGIYNSIMVIDVEKKGKCYVPVGYVNEGIPAINVIIEQGGDEVTLGWDGWFNFRDRNSAQIINNSEGILIWNITKYPEWVKIEYNQAENQIVYPHYGGIGFGISYNTDYKLTERKMSGQIVISSNAKNQPEYVINVTYIAGIPSINCYNNIVFYASSPKQSFSISNSGQGNIPLTWELENCPDWLTWSKTSGSLYPSDHDVITITCHPAKIPEGTNSAVLTIKSNDSSNPEYSVYVYYYHQ